MIRVFPRRTSNTPADDMAFIGDPQLFRPESDEVHISCTFTWDIEEAYRLHRAWSVYYDNVEIGGPAFGDGGGEFYPGRYLKDGITITSRGCSKNCEWCFVPKREGWIRELEIKPGHIIQDNNLLACSRKHIESVFDMLKKNNKGAVFIGGLDAELFQPYHADLLRSIKVKSMWFACDYAGAITNIERVSELISDMSIEKKRCYVMIGHNGETVAKANDRLESVYRLGFLPMALLYRGENEMRKSWRPKDWADLQRFWARPALYRAAFDPVGA